MANDPFAVRFQDSQFGYLPQAVIPSLLSSSGITAKDIESDIDIIFSDLYTNSLSGSVSKAGRDALTDVRSTWKFLQANTDELTRTGYYMQLIDRILHHASIYGLTESRRPALAVRELVYNLKVGFSQDEPTLLNPEVCTVLSSGQTRERLLTVLFDSTFVEDL